MKTSDFLLELGCEELPPKLLPQLSQALTHNLSTQLDSADLAYDKAITFATPRRLAVLVLDLQIQQSDQSIERKGPKVGAPEQAVQGFAKSCGVLITDLTQKTLNKTNYYYFIQQKKGLRAADLLADIVATAIKKIPIAKPMFWGDGDISFVRPVHWLVMLLGSEVIKANIMGLKSGNTTRGMRFSGTAEFCITQASDYQKTLLNKANIEVDFEARKTIIRQQITFVAANNQAKAVIDEALLSEVCALVEAPKAFAGEFDTEFLNMPEEVLISAMKLHQKYFYMVDESGKLLPAFISVANICPKDLSIIISGNERVIRSRLSDAQFFWQQDKGVSSKSRLTKLGGVLFMQSLGSMADKAKRIEILSAYIANQIDANIDNCKRAGLLCKSDLVSDLVGEFADLQGIMGGYYARNDGETKAVSEAISEHYHPRFSGDTLPSTKAGLAVAIADKIDSIVGIYGIGHKPTGSKDPYGLKRAGLGLLRIIIEKKLKISLLDLIFKSAKLYKFDNKIGHEIYDFISERLGAYYQEQGIDKSVVKAVLAVRNDKEHAENSVYDWHLRIQVLDKFMQDDNSKSLIEANKRIKNILKDVKVEEVLPNGDSVFDDNLLKALQAVSDKGANNNYLVIIQQLLKLKPVIDDFFDNVMVNDENLEIRKRRLSLINKIRQSFLRIADFTYLSK